jgi:hypothetical protein
MALLGTDHCDHPADLSICLHHRLDSGHPVSMAGGWLDDTLCLPSQQVSLQVLFQSLRDIVAKVCSRSHRSVHVELELDFREDLFFRPLNCVDVDAEFQDPEFHRRLSTQQSFPSVLNHQDFFVAAGFERVIHLDINLEAAHDHERLLGCHAVELLIASVLRVEDHVRVCLPHVLPHSSSDYCHRGAGVNCESDLGSSQPTPDSCIDVLFRPILWMQD